MPRLSFWFVRAALIYLGLGFTFGALMLSNKGVPYYPPLWRLLPAHVEFLLLGWTLQLIMGTAFWIAPRTWEPPGRGDERPAWLAFFLLNGGIWLVALGGWLILPPAATLLGRAAELAAAIAFARHIWPRVVSREGDG